MALVADQVVVALEARIGAYLANVTRAQVEFDRRMAAIERRAVAAQRNVSSTFARFFTLGAVTLATRELAEYADTWTQVGRALEATESLFGLRLRSQSELADMAKETRSDLLSLTKLYTRTAASTRELALSEQDVATVTTTVAKALKLGSASASEQASTMLQLSQAFAKGKLDGDEFRTVMENATVVQAALSRHLGVTRGEIIKMAADGKIKVNDLIAALLKIAPEVDRAFSKSTATIDESMTNITTSLIELVGSFSDATGAGDAIADMLADVADAIDLLASKGRALQYIAASFRTLFDVMTGQQPRTLLQLMGEDLGFIPPGSTPPSSRNFNRRFGDSSGDNRLSTLADRLRALNTPAVAGGGGSADADKAQEKLQRALDKAREHIDALKLERETLGASTFEITRRKTALELTNDALAAGVELTPKLRTEIELLAIQTANHTAALEMEEAALDRANAAAMDFFNATKQGFSDVILGAKSFDEALVGLLKRFAEIAIDNAFTALFSPMKPGATSASGIFGSLGSLFAGFFADGGRIPSGKFGIAGERGPELVTGPATVYPSSEGGGGTKHVVIELVESPMLRPVIREVSAGVSIKITREALSANNKAQARQQLTRR